MDKDSAALEPNKLFVGGLSWTTTNDSLRDYFSQFGEVTDSIVMYDNETRKPRGFGFVTFKDNASVGNALGKSEHMLDNKQIDPKHAKFKGKGNSIPKIFIGGLSHDVTSERILKFFNEELEFSSEICAKSMEIKKDQKSSSRGFGFMEVDSAQSGLKLVVENGPNYTIDGKRVELKWAHDHKASNREGNSQSSNNATAPPNMMYPPHGFYSTPMYNRGGNSPQYTQNGPAGNYIASSYGFQHPNPHRMHSTGYHHQHQNFDNYQPSSSYYSGGSGQYSSIGYSGGGPQQMGNYPAESTYTQTSSTFTGNDSYSNSSVMSFAYGPTTGGGYHHPHQYGGSDHQNGGGSPSTYSRPTGFPSQGRSTGGGSGGGSSIHSNNYPSYGNH